jgi:hypothetical protein
LGNADVAAGVLAAAAGEPAAAADGGAAAAAAAGDHLVDWRRQRSGPGVRLDHEAAAAATADDRTGADAADDDLELRSGLQLRRSWAERVVLAERGPRLVRPFEGDQRQRPLQMPMARGGDVVGGRIDCVQERQRLGVLLFLQASATRLSRAPASFGFRASASRSSVSAVS